MDHWRVECTRHFRKENPMLQETQVPGRDHDGGEVAELTRHLAGADITANDGMIHHYARTLSGIGVRREKLVALFAPNTPDALAIRYGVHLLGLAPPENLR
jgi:hypothetical protein